MRADVVHACFMVSEIQFALRNVHYAENLDSPGGFPGINFTNADVHCNQTDAKRRLVWGFFSKKIRKCNCLFALCCLGCIAKVKAKPSGSEWGSNPFVVIVALNLF